MSAKERKFLRTHTCTLTDAEVNHLRNLLNHLRLEYMLDEDMHKGAEMALASMLESNMITKEEADEQRQKRLDGMNRLPKSIQHSIKMLQKTIKPFEADVIDVDSRTVLEIGNHTDQ